MESTIPDMRGQIADLLIGVIDLHAFMHWYWANYDTIEQLGNDEDVDLLNDVFLLNAEYTSSYINAAEFVDGLREGFLP